MKEHSPNLPYIIHTIEIEKTLGNKQIFLCASDNSSWGSIKNEKYNIDINPVIIVIIYFLQKLKDKSPLSTLWKSESQMVFF